MERARENFPCNLCLTSSISLVNFIRLLICLNEEKFLLRLNFNVHVKRREDFAFSSNWFVLNAEEGVFWRLIEISCFFLMRNNFKHSNQRSRNDLSYGLVRELRHNVCKKLSLRWWKIMNLVRNLRRLLWGSWGVEASESLCRIRVEWRGGEKLYSDSEHRSMWPCGGLFSL